MNITNNITNGMTAQDKEIYFAHMAMRHRQEAEKLEYERQTRMAYKQSLIDGILMHNKNFTRDELNKKTIRVLERIF